MSMTTMKTMAAFTLRVEIEMVRGGGGWHWKWAINLHTKIWHIYPYGYRLNAWACDKTTQWHYISAVTLKRDVKLTDWHPVYVPPRCRFVKKRKNITANGYSNSAHEKRTKCKTYYSSQTQSFEIIKFNIQKHRDLNLHAKHSSEDTQHDCPIRAVCSVQCTWLSDTCSVQCTAYI